MVEAGSVSAAASRLGVSQASVSQHVRQLESFCGAELLGRSIRPGKPTSAGQRLLEHAAKLLSLADEMAHGVRSFSRSKRAVVRIGCVDSFAATIGPQLVRALPTKVHKVRLFSGLSPALISQFSNQQMDLLIAAGDIGNSALVDRRALLSEHYCVVVPADHDTRGLTTLTGLAQHLQFMHYSARSVMGTQVTSYLQGTDPAIERAFEFDATDPMLALVPLAGAPLRAAGKGAAPVGFQPQRQALSAAGADLSSGQPGGRIGPIARGNSRHRAGGCAGAQARDRGSAPAGEHGHQHRRGLLTRRKGSKATTSDGQTSRGGRCDVSVRVAGLPIAIAGFPAFSSGRIFPIDDSASS